MQSNPANFPSVALELSQSRRPLFLLLLALLFIACWLGASLGAAKFDLVLPLETLVMSLGLNGETELSGIQNIVLNIRLPRVLMAVLVGAALAVSGASLQGMCRLSLIHI